MKWQSIKLDLSDQEIQALKDQNAKLIQHLEERQPLNFENLKGLKSELTKAISKNCELGEILKKIEGFGGDHYIVQLTHDDNEILNLPWHIAEMKGQSLGSIARLHITKSLPESLKKSDGFYQPTSASPLKILIMISSPNDSDYKNVLSYDKEEFEILKAFEPLMRAGTAEIDFTDDGSLESLETKIKANKYHILHFSGHGIYKNDRGYLALENPLNLTTDITTAADFAETLVCRSDHKIPLIMLSSYQTAQGTTEKGLRGVTNQLLRVGTPAVISMGMSVLDKYAAAFSAYFYQQISQKENIHSAFSEATRFIRELESENNRKNRLTANQIPLQWTIPNLYINAKIEQLVDWKTAPKALELTSYRFLIEQNRIILKHDQNYRFIGRRGDKAKLLEPFFKKMPLLLKGQGGVGKTSMAEHLVQRLIAKNPKTYPFVFDKNLRKADEIMAILKNFIIQNIIKDRKERYEFISIFDNSDTIIDKLSLLLPEFINYQPVFVFDNLEVFQTVPGKTFSDEYQDISEVIDFLCKERKYHLILTCRYPVKDFENIRSFDLNQVQFNDFWKKCDYITINSIRNYLFENAIEKWQEGNFEKEEVTFEDVVRMIYRTFGGNYRALELFDKFYQENQDKIHSELHNQETFQQEMKRKSQQIREKMAEDLIFSKLMSLLTKEQQNVLRLLANFRIPVQDDAMKLQFLPPDPHRHQV